MNDQQCINHMVLGAPQPITVLYLNTSGTLNLTPLPLLTKEQDFNTVSGNMLFRPSASMNAAINFIAEIQYEIWTLDDMGADIQHIGPSTFRIDGGGGPTPGFLDTLGSLWVPGSPFIFNLKKITGKLVYGFRWTYTPLFWTPGTFDAPQFIFVPTTNS